MTVSEIEARWPSIGRLIDLTVTQRNGYGGWGGRVLQMTIIGTKGTTTVTGYGFMDAFAWPGRSNGLQGNWFTPLYWRGVLQSAPSAVTMYAGESKTITVRITNTGTASWPVGGNVHLANYSASDLASTAFARDGSHSFHITAGGQKAISQTIAFGGGHARSFILGGWNRANGASAGGGPVELTATARYTDGSTQAWHVPFARNTHSWVYAEQPFTTASKPLSSITVAATFANQTGDAYFDALRLLESPILNPSFESGMTGWSGSGL